MPRFFNKILPWGLLGLSLVVLFFMLRKPDEKALVPEVKHHLLLERMEQLGRLELCRMYIKDVIDYKEAKEWYRMDPNVVIIMHGEVIGCVDLAKVDSTDILLGDSTLIVTLPKPEICVHKVDHARSRIYDVKSLIFDDDAILVDRAYKAGEAAILKSALEMDIYGETRKNAIKLLGPLLESTSGKQVTIRFKE
jgi:hypothetical protein